jgi:geranylgeranyl pyrophosphate synthase
VGGGTHNQVQALRLYGRKVGTAFQVLNTIRNLQGVEPGRPVATDIRKRRDTVLTAWLRDGTGVDIRAGIKADGTDDEELGDAQVGAFREALEIADAIPFAERLASGLLDEAREALLEVDDSPERTVLNNLAEDELFRIYAF